MHQDSSIPSLARPKVVSAGDSVLLEEGFADLVETSVGKSKTQIMIQTQKSIFTNYSA